MYYYYYINSFYIYSFFGYIYEIITNYILHHKYYPNILLEPIKPIYGIGVLIVLFIEKIVFNKLKINKNLKKIIFVLINIIILTLLEYITGVILYKIFHKSYWDYSNYYLHIGKYVCILVSLLWGLFSYIYLVVLQTRVNQIIKKIPLWFSNIMLIITISDILFSFIN